MITMQLRDDRSEKVNYEYADYPIYIRKGLLSSYSGYAAPSHWHDDIELIYILDGEMQYNVNGEILTLDKGEGIFVNSRALHYGFSDNHKECEFICVLLHPLLLCSSVQTERQFVLPITANQSMVYIKLQQNIAWQKTIVDCIAKLYQVRNQSTAPLSVTSLFFEIWANIYANTPHDVANIGNADLTTVKNMVGFVQTNYEKRITLQDIARAGFIGQSKCCKLFRQYIGQTPIEYLTQYRLNKSLQLLQNTDMTVTEIATAVGFNGNSYFAETFKKFYGKTPSECRNINEHI